VKVRSDLIAYLIKNYKYNSPELYNFVFVPTVLSLDESNLFVWMIAYQYQSSLINEKKKKRSFFHPASGAG